MGIDEWMIAEAAMRPGTLLVRLYAWNPGAITIGYHQQPERAVLIDQIGETPIIRRITGGRGVYHDPSELTYSVAYSFPFALDRDNDRELSATAKHEFERFVQQLLTSVLAGLGRPASVTHSSDPLDRAPLTSVKAPCFASRSRSEITHPDGSKLVARAGRSSGSLFFEHGSIKLGAIASHPALPLTGSTASPLPLTNDQIRGAAALFEKTLQLLLTRKVDANPELSEEKRMVLDRDTILQLSTRQRDRLRDFPLAQRHFGSLI